MPLLEAINSGKAPKLAMGGLIGGGSLSNTYAPSLAINVQGSGNQKQDAALAGMIADTVDRTLKANQPRDGFRLSKTQALAKQAQEMQHAAGRNG